MTKPAAVSTSDLQPYELPLVNVAKYVTAKNGDMVCVGGQHAMGAAVDTVVTGLVTVAFVMVGLDTDPADDPAYVSGSIGDQAGTPAAGSILISAWTFTNVANDATPAASGATGAKVNWLAFGTKSATRDDPPASTQVAI